MTTFAKKTFDAAVYSFFRPTYPKQLFSVIFDYHRTKSDDASWDVAVDLGCGTGAWMFFDENSMARRSYVATH